MIELSEWDSDFIAKSKRYTRRYNVYKAGRTLVLLLIPLCLVASRLFDTSIRQQPYPAILLYFCTVVFVFTLEKVIWAIIRRRKRRFIYHLVETIPKLALLCLSIMLWCLLYPGHIAYAIGVWWLTGIFLALIRYFVIRWALKEAILQTKNYKLFGRRIGRFTKRKKHDKALLYDLPDESAFDRYTVMALISYKPKIYVSAGARRILEPDELRTIIAHEMGHSWSLHIVGCEVADWIRRIFFVPALVSAASKLLSSTPLWAEHNEIFVFLILVTLIWQLNIWMSYLLGSPIELGSDLYAVEVTRTPKAFVEAMTKLSEERPYNVFPNMFDTLGFCSHPCIVKRLRQVAIGS